jgi:type III restriction enzyme
VRQIALDTEGALDIELMVYPCARNPEVSDNAWCKIDGLPKYRRPVQDYKNEVQRGAALAEMLVDRAVVTVKDDDPTPEDDLRALILAEMARIDGANKKTVDTRVRDLLELDMNRRTLTYAGAKSDKQDEGTTTTKDVHFRDIDAYFSNACRRLPEGSGAWYFEQLVAQNVPTRKAKMRVAAVAELADVNKSLNSVARKQIDELRQLYEDRVEQRGLSIQFKSVWYPPTKPIEDVLVLKVPPKVAVQKTVKKGNEIEVKDLPLLTNHVYAFQNPGDGAYLYPGSSNSWEEAALSLELGTNTIAAWFRNPNSGGSALSVPYWVGGKPDEGKLELLHPDFVFVHEIQGQLFVDIIDPHLDHGDSLDKWRGLAKYAADHADRIRRAVAVARVGQTDWGLNLSKPEVRAALDNPSASLDEIFQKYGNKRIKG